MANRMQRQGLDGRPRKFFAILTSQSESSKKWFAMAHENHRNEGYARFGACLTFKWVGQAVRANRMHRQALDGCPQKHLTFLTSESGLPKKWCSIAHENCRNEGMLASGLV